LIFSLRLLGYRTTARCICPERHFQVLNGGERATAGRPAQVSGGYFFDDGTGGEGRERNVVMRPVRLRNRPNRIWANPWDNHGRRINARPLFSALYVA